LASENQLKFNAHLAFKPNLIAVTFEPEAKESEKKKQQKDERKYFRLIKEPQQVASSK